MIRNERFDADGRCVEAEIVDLAAGTVTYEVDGKVVESRQLTPEEAAQFATPPPTDADRLAALEAQNAALLAALAKVTTLAQVRTAAAAAELARPPHGLTPPPHGPTRRRAGPGPPS